MPTLSDRIIVPEPEAIRMTQTPTGRVVLRQADQIITIPPEYLRDAALEIAACVQQLVPSQ
jgi:hypothetical protein